MSALRKTFGNAAGNAGKGSGPRPKTWQDTDAARSLGQNLLRQLQKQFPDKQDALWLIRNGAALDETDTRGTTPLHAALLNGFADLVREMVARGAPVNAQNSAGNTPLIAAVNGGNADIITLLIDAGADVAVANKAGNTALACAAAHGNAESVKLLLAAGAPADDAAMRIARSLKKEEIRDLLEAARAAAAQELIEGATVTNQPVRLLRPVQYRRPGKPD